VECGSSTQQEKAICVKDQYACPVNDVILTSTDSEKLELKEKGYKELNFTDSAVGLYYSN